MLQVIVNFFSATGKIISVVLSRATSFMNGTAAKHIDYKQLLNEFNQKSSDNITKINVTIQEQKASIKDDKANVEKCNLEVVTHVRAINGCDEKIESLAKSAIERQFTAEERMLMDKYTSDRRIMNMAVTRNLARAERLTQNITRKEENIVRLNQIKQENVEKTYTIRFELEELIEEREINKHEVVLDEIKLGGYSIEELKSIVKAENIYALAKAETRQLLDIDNSTTANKYIEEQDVTTNAKVQELLDKHKKGENIEQVISDNLNKIVIETQQQYQYA